MLFNLLKINITESVEWKGSKLSNQNFLEKYGLELSRLLLGASFSPEHLKWLYENESLPYSDEKIIESLKFITQDLGIKDIRLGIRWNNSVDKHGNIDLSYYKKTLDFLFNQNINICLNPGPIKTFRWPEQHVPLFILENINRPKKGGIIKPDSYLALKAYEFINALFISLEKEYSKKKLNKIKIIQLENEPFHRFGEYGWTIHEDYLKQLYKIVIDYLPTVSFLTNSSEYRNLDQISNFYKYVTGQNPDLKNRLISGVNYFYKVPIKYKIPFTGRVDSISWKSYLFEKNKKLSQKIGYQIEITEGQAESWAKITTPGNSSSEFRFMILRCANHILDTERQSVLRIWGIEGLAKKGVEGRLNSEHKEIANLIRFVNYRSQ